MAEDTIPFFRKSVLFESGDLDQIRSFQATFADPDLLDLGVNALSVRSSVAQRSRASFFYTELVGDMIRTADCPIDTVAYGIVVSGTATLHSSLGTQHLRSGDSAVALPGSTAVQESQNLRALSVRMRVPRSVKLRLHTYSPSNSIRNPIVLDRASGENMARLLAFFAREHDRLADSTNHLDQGHLDGLADLIQRRLIHLVNSILGIDTLQPSTSMEICSACDEVITQHLGNKFSVNELSRIVGFSERQVYRAFEAVAGLSPADYGSRIRLIEARRAILAYAPDPRAESEIASAFGFLSWPSFVKRYVATFGIDPKTERHERYALLASLSETVRTKRFPRKR